MGFAAETDRVLEYAEDELYLGLGKLEPVAIEIERRDRVYRDTDGGDEVGEQER